MIDMWTHTLLVVGCLALAYYAGYFVKTKGLSVDISEKAMYNFIKFLEEGGFIKTDIDKDGDLELIPIKQIVEQHNNIKEKDYETRNIL